MEKKPIASASKTQEIIKEHDLVIKKKFGQNFLIDPSIVGKIAKSIPTSDKLCVIEVGPGIGALTEQLAKVADKVVGYEIDKDLLPILAENLSGLNVEIINQDILTVDIKSKVDELVKQGYQVSFAANLPYYITTPILFAILESKAPINTITVMVQKEVADRFAAKIQTKEYNALSVIVQYLSNVKTVLKVPKEVFIPKPNVDSAVVQFTLRPYQRTVQNEQQFFELVKGCFVQRRKTILNNLKEYLQDRQLAQDALAAAKIEENRRAEQCTIDEFINLYEVIYEN